MNLPFFKKFNKKIIPLYYLVLVLRDEKAHAVIFEEIENKIRIVGQKEQYFSTTIDEISSEEMLQVLDSAISGAESFLPENIQTQKTIFGVKQSWTDNDQIKKERLGKLKKVSGELGLVPIGFLVISQAISHLLQKEEGMPVSAILAEINKESVTVTLLRAGKNIGTKTSEIHDSIPFTVDTILKHFNIAEILPSRIILFNDTQDYSQEFISYTWSKSLPFLHLPQILHLPHGFDAKAVLFGAATQMGFEVLEKDIPKEDSIQDESADDTKINKNVSPDESSISKNLGAEDFGFTKDTDVAKIEFQEPSLETKEIANVFSQNAQDGNSVSIDTGKTYTEAESPGRFVFIKRSLTIVFTFIANISRKMNVKKNPLNALSGKSVIIIPTILILLIALIASYFLFLKAVITIAIDPQIESQTKNVTFSTTKTTDPISNIVKGELVSTSQEGSVSTPATGKKEVGTPAKGKITVFNSLTQSKALAEGTTLKSPNGLEFTLDSSVMIDAVASHSADETVSPEKTTVNVTANQLGKESNLPSGTKFSVASFDTSDIIAKNDDPFSGGTKKEITVISKNDSIKLETNLIKQLGNQAKNNLEKQLDSNKILLPSFLTEKLSKQSLSAKVGDEASQLTLTGTVSYQGIFYDKSDLATFIKSFLSKNISPNQEIDYNNIKTTVDVKNKTDKEIYANLNVKALLLPKIDNNKVAKDFKGKSFEAVQSYINKLPQVANVNIELSPNIPFLPKTLPSREKNIKILIKINE